MTRRRMRKNASDVTMWALGAVGVGTVLYFLLPKKAAATGTGALPSFAPTALPQSVRSCASMDGQMDAATTAYMTSQTNSFNAMTQACGRDKAVRALRRQLSRLNASW